MYLKPFYGNPENSFSHINTGKTRLEIYKDIFLSLNFPSKFNALYSKFGIIYFTQKKEIIDYIFSRK